MPIVIVLLVLSLLAPLNLVAGLGLPNALVFEPSPDALTIASASGALPILYDSGDPEAVHIAVNTFAEDVQRVTGVKPEIYQDDLPNGSSAAIIVGTIGSVLLRNVRCSFENKNTHSDGAQTSFAGYASMSENDWESFNARVVAQPLKGIEEALVIAGSDKVSSW